MKVFSIIMMLIILGLHLTPCSDTATLHEQQDSALLKQGPLSANHSHATHPDACSPFCHCVCCTTSTLVAPATLLSLNSPVYKPTFTKPIPSSLIEVYLPIWQPPQLSV